MKSAKNNCNENYLIWLCKDQYYRNDIWILSEHKYFSDLTVNQQKEIYGKKCLDFSLCTNLIIRNEIKNAYAYLLEYKITNLRTLFHDKYIMDNMMIYFSKNYNENFSILDFEKDEILLEYEKYLKNKGIVTKSRLIRISKDMEVKEYIERNKTLNMVKRVYEINKSATQIHLKEHFKDIWDIRKLDIHVTGFNYARPRYTINFMNIYQNKIKEVVKRYEYERLKVNKYSTIIDDLKAINLFSKFLYEKYPKVDSLDKLTRKIVLDFLAYIEGLDMTHTTKGQRKGCIRVFLNLVVMYSWKHTPREKLISKSDYTKKITYLPKPIGAHILEKLNKNLKFLPIEISRMVYILQNIGMRPNEVCQLKIGSVKKDSEGDYFLEYYQSKTDKYSRIPIADEVAEVIITQEKETLERFKNSKYIFTRDGEKPVAQESVSYHINKLAFERDIRDENNNLYRFKIHHFRHTVASKYVNSGMDPNMIRIMLGHSKMKSIMSYIKLRDSTVLKEMEDILKEQNKIIGSLNGESVGDEKEEIDLIHGKCLKPSSNLCSCISKCYNCSMFSFNSCDKESFESYLHRVEENINYTKANGFTRMMEINTEIKNNIKKLIDIKN